MRWAQKLSENIVSDQLSSADTPLKNLFPMYEKYKCYFIIFKLEFVH